MSDRDEQVVNGWAFPASVSVPSSQEKGWTRTKMGGETIWIAGREILVDIAHQAGLKEIDVERVDSGSGMDGVAYAAAKATVRFDDYPTTSAIGSIDQVGNSLEDMWSTAETRATKRAIKAALNVRSTSGKLDDADVAGETTKTGGNISHGPDGSVDIDPPDEYKDENGGPGDGPSDDEGFEF